MNADQFSEYLLLEMFKLRPNELIAITADPGSEKEVVFALYETAERLGSKPLLLFIPQAEYDGEIGMKVWPSESLLPALSKVDIWIDAQSAVMLYSSLWEDVLAKNQDIRYLVIGETKLSSLVRTFTGFDIAALDQLLVLIREKVMASDVISITSQNGTSLTYKTDLNYSFDMDSGDFRSTKFGTAPGYVNIIPKKSSLNGTIVFDELMLANISSDNKIAFKIKNGRVTKVYGGNEAEKFRQELERFEDPNMYMVSHNMIGLNPSVRSLSGEIVEDERIWGGVDFGFGYTSPMDMPPDGIKAVSHFDGVIENVTLKFDREVIFENGEMVHPDFVPLAKALLRSDHGGKQ